jgi:hypothetical protein
MYQNNENGSLDLDTHKHRTGYQRKGRSLKDSLRYTSPGRVQSQEGISYTLLGRQWSEN